MAVFTHMSSHARFPSTRSGLVVGSVCCLSFSFLWCRWGAFLLLFWGLHLPLSPAASRLVPRFPPLGSPALVSGQPWFPFYVEGAAGPARPLHPCRMWESWLWDCSAHVWLLGLFLLLLLWSVNGIGIEKIILWCFLLKKKTRPTTEGGYHVHVKHPRAQHPEQNFLSRKGIHKVPVPLHFGMDTKRENYTRLCTRA